jgi:hypothetical protein
MTGIYLLFAIALWLFIVFWLAKILTTKLSMSWWGVLVRVILFLALLPLPLIDEIVGKRQFEQLCRENSTIQVNRATALGRTVYLKSLPDVVIDGVLIPITLHSWVFVDASTGQPVLSYNSLRATGGRFIRTLGISEGSMPLLFRGSCEPVGSPASVETFKNFGINYIEPPINNNKEVK